MKLPLRLLISLAALLQTSPARATADFFSGPGNGADGPLTVTGTLEASAVRAAGRAAVTTDGPSGSER